jgi:hypothetical protein
MSSCGLAIIHYKPDPNDCAIIKKEQVGLSLFHTFLVGWR